jgi:hypothetical protein
MPEGPTTQVGMPLDRLAFEISDGVLGLLMIGGSGESLTLKSSLWLSPALLITPV